jgi:hypothetical protein
MEKARKHRIVRLATYVGVAMLVAAVINRVLAYWAGGDTHLFDQLLVITCIIIPLAGTARILRIYRRG